MVLDLIKDLANRADEPPRVTELFRPRLPVVANLPRVVTNTICSPRLLRSLQGDDIAFALRRNLSTSGLTESFLHRKRNGPMARNKGAMCGDLGARLAPVPIVHHMSVPAVPDAMPIT
jgi:hypothetical protein